MNVAKVDYKSRMNRQKKEVNEKAEGKGRRKEERKKYLLRIQV